jgi:hypothetical protein
MITQLEVGLPSSALGLMDLPVPLTRGEYMKLSSAGIMKPEEVWSKTDIELQSLLGKTRAD